MARFWQKPRGEQLRAVLNRMSSSKISHDAHFPWRNYCYFSVGFDIFFYNTTQLFSYLKPEVRDCWCSSFSLLSRKGCLLSYCLDSDARHPCMHKGQSTFSQIERERRLHTEIYQLWHLKKYVVLPVSWLAKLKGGLSIKIVTAGIQVSLSYGFRSASNICCIDSY